MVLVKSQQIVCGLMILQPRIRTQSLRIGHNNGGRTVP